jgi:death on curing protein
VTEQLRDPDFLTVEDVLELHADQLRLFGGGHGIRDQGALESAVAMPQASFDGSLPRISLSSTGTSEPP